MMDVELNDVDLLQNAAIAAVSNGDHNSTSVAG
jgi:hypothetical protein